MSKVSKNTKSNKKRSKKSFESGIVHIAAKWNNTIITLTDPSGNVLGWSSAGLCGFKGARQSTPYAGQMAAEKLGALARTFGITNVSVKLRGMGPGRDQTIRGLMNGGLVLDTITEKTRVPHGGGRQRRIRKV